MANNHNTCSTCEWRNVDNTIHNGKCQRYPPPWEAVDPDDWCGEYRQDEATTKAKAQKLDDYRAELREKSYKRKQQAAQAQKDASK